MDRRPGLGHGASSLHASEQAIHRMYRPMHDLASSSSFAPSSSHPSSSTTATTHGPGVTHTPHASTHPTPSDIHSTSKVSFSPESILYTTPAAAGGAGAEASSGRFFGASKGTHPQHTDTTGLVSGSGIGVSGVQVMGADEGGSSFVAADMSVGAAHNTSLSVPSTTPTTTPMASNTNQNNNNNVTAGMASSSSSASSSSYLLEGIVDDSSGYQEGYWRNKYNSGNSMNNSLSHSGGRGFGTSSGVKTMR